MIEFKHGNLLEAKTDAVVNTVNCVGVMGKGIALQFKQMWPDNFKLYKQACDRKELRPGKLLVWDAGLFKPRYIINFPTKDHWKGKSKIEYIDSGLKELKRFIIESDVKSISIPPLGCGNGGLNWGEVKKHILNALSDIDGVEITIYEPGFAPKSSERVIRTEAKLTLSRALLIKAMSAYQDLAYRLTQLEIQKIAYFMQEIGLLNKLRFVKGDYGPYADNLNHVLSALEGHYTSGYTGERKKDVRIELKENALSAAQQLIDRELPSEEQSKLDRISKLMDGFETPYGMELLSTVHWLVKNENVTDTHSLVQKVGEWNDRKKTLFPARHITVAYNILQSRGWFN